MKSKAQRAVDELNRNIGYVYPIFLLLFVTVGLDITVLRYYGITVSVVLHSLT
jgi:hypothetical protein